MIVEIPCPFCKEVSTTEVMDPYTGYAHVLCNECGARGPELNVSQVEEDDEWKEVVREAWNDAYPLSYNDPPLKKNTTP